MTTYEQAVIDAAKAYYEAREGCAGGNEDDIIDAEERIVEVTRILLEQTDWR